MANAQGSAWHLAAPPPYHGLRSSHVIKVVAVDHDHRVRRLLSEELGHHGFEVTTFADGPALLRSADACADVIILEWTLPSMSGIQLLTQLRQTGIVAPVVFLTGQPLINSENLAFASGAVDFVDKSRGIGILIRRLRVLVYEQPVDGERPRWLHRGNLAVTPSGGRAFWKNVDVGLTACDFKIVLLLADKNGTPATYREIYDAMHYSGFVAGYGEDGYRVNVRSAIKRIRRKFRKLESRFDEIKNVPAIGYAWGQAAPDTSAMSNSLQ